MGYEENPVLSHSLQPTSHNPLARKSRVRVFVDNSRVWTSALSEIPVRRIPVANEDWAKDPNTRPEVLAMLSTSPSETVRLLVAQNPSTPETALMHLAKDEDDSVRKAITHRSQVSSEVLRIAALPRELLAQLDLPETPPVAEAEAAPAEEFVWREPGSEQVSTPAPQPEPEPLPMPVPAKKPGLFAWFWRLFGRSA